MPYILVNMVLDIFSLILFCMTSAALLSKYPLTNRYLPAQLRNPRAVAFIAQGLVGLVLSIVAVRVVAGGRSTVVAQPVFELFYCVGLANTVVLIYQFLDGRYLLHMPKVQRRLLLAISAVVMTSAFGIAVFLAAVLLFMIR